MISPFLKLRLSHSCKKITSDVLQCQTTNERGALLQGRTSRQRIRKCQGLYITSSSAEPINKTAEPLRQTVPERAMMSTDRKPLRVHDLHSLHLSFHHFCSSAQTQAQSRPENSDRITSIHPTSSACLDMYMLSTLPSHLRLFPASRPS